MKQILKLTLQLFIVAAVTTALLAMTHAFTLEPIANQIKMTQEKMMKAILKKLTPKTTWCKVNLVLTGVLVVAFAAKIYMDAYSNDPGCPQCEVPKCQIGRAHV